MSAPRFPNVDRTLSGLFVVSALALLVRLYGLGTRVFHWDEGRVGYWTLRYAESGIFEYSPIIHGPFLPLVNSSVFEVLGATDATARLVVAVVGGTLPLAAWLFRAHLTDIEVVGVGFLLAFNPILIYYSRFMRNDVLVAGFSLFALGFAVRALDTRDVRRLYPAVVFLALAFTTKGNALLYVLCYVGATLLVLDHLLVRSTANGRSVRATLQSWLVTGWDALREMATGRNLEAPERMASWRRTIAWSVGHLLGLMVTGTLVIVWFYAPRPDLWDALVSPALLPDLVYESTVGSGRELVDLWLSGDMQEHDYMEYAVGLGSTLVHAAPVVVVFSLVGMAVDAMEGRNRLFVAFAFYWGVASVIGYPAATDIRAAWTATHVIVPLVFPAAVGLGFVIRSLRANIDMRVVAARIGRPGRSIADGSGGSTEDSDLPDVGDDSPTRTSMDLRTIVDGDSVAVLLAGLLLLGAFAGILVPTATYWNSTNPDHTAVVQWAQPHNDMRESLDDMEAIIRTHDGETDVLFVGTDHPGRGDAFYVANESQNDQRHAGSGWYDRLPLPWYLERSDATVNSTPPDADRADVAADAPPVVIAWANDKADLEPHLDGYVVRQHEARLWGFRIVFFFEEEALESADRLDT